MPTSNYNNYQISCLDQKKKREKKSYYVELFNALHRLPFNK